MTGIVIDTKPGFVVSEIRSKAELDLPALARLFEQGWSADYRGRMRLLFNESFLEWILDGDDWMATVVTRQDSGEPVGFALSLFRTLLCKDTRLKTDFGTLMTVAAECRRQGVARWIYDSMKVLFDRRGTEVALVSFHLGQAGKPTVSSSVQRTDGMDMHSLLESPVLGLELAKRRPRLGPAVKSMGQAYFDSNQRFRCDSTGEIAGLSSVMDVESAVTSQYAVAVAPCDSYRRFFLSPPRPDQRGGMLWFDFGQGVYCSMGYLILDLALDESNLGHIAQVHCWLSAGCTAEHWAAALHDACTYVEERGCLGVAMYRQGVFEANVPEAIGFEPVDELLSFAVHGPAQNVGLFKGVAGPILLDDL